MLQDPSELAAARRAMREVAGAHLFDPNVTCIDLGMPMRNGVLVDDLEVRVHVHRKLDEVRLERAVAAGQTRPLPEMLDGVGVDVLEGNYQPHLFGWSSPVLPGVGSARARRADPMIGGISISTELDVAYGTLGAKVVDAVSGQEMLLSAWHVLAGEPEAPPGVRIYQPGRLDGSTRADTVAVLSRHAMAVGLDAAVATLTGDRTLVNRQLGLGAVTGLGRAVLGQRLLKSSRASGITQGLVSGVEGIARISYDGLDRLVRGVVTIDPVEGAEVSRPGDSGALWMVKESGLIAVGLHFAGGDSPERALAIDLRMVLAALGVRLDIRRPPMAA